MRRLLAVLGVLFSGFAAGPAFADGSHEQEFGGWVGSSHFSITFGQYESDGAAESYFRARVSDDAGGDVLTGGASRRSYGTEGDTDADLFVAPSQQALFVFLQSSEPENSCTVAAMHFGPGGRTLFQSSEMPCTPSTALPYIPL